MRISIILLIYLILFNSWGALIQEYDIDDQLGINAETGESAALEAAQRNASSIQTGQSIGQTLLGYYNSLLNTVEGMFYGLNPGVQLLVNILPWAIAQSLIAWAFGALEIIVAADILAYARGVGL